MDIKSEALRYLGFGGSAPDERTRELLERAVSELERIVSPSYCYKLAPVRDCGFLLEGSDIIGHLAGCERAVFFAATLGTGADRLIRTAQVADMAYAVVLDAAASAFIEDFCDKAQQEIAKGGDLSLTWRFSPGYGDYPLSVQPRLIRFLDADKHIGLTVTQSGMLAPCKSVTAVMGAIDGKGYKGTTKRGCEGCRMNGKCPYGKEGKGCGRN